MSDEKTPIWNDQESGKDTGGLGASGGETEGAGALYHDSTQSPRAVSEQQGTLSPWKYKVNLLHINALLYQKMYASVPSKLICHDFGSVCLQIGSIDVRIRI